MKVAFVHHWLVNYRGGERVLQALCNLYPEADIFTHVFAPENLPDSFRQRRVFTSFINRLPKAAKWYPYYLPLMPLALERLDLRGYDLVISIESGPSKGVIVDPGATHLCYCNTPMRYIWDMSHDYMEQCGCVKRFLSAPLFHYLRMWDVTTAARVDSFACNSQFVAKRIKKYYRREAEVVYPPVDLDDFQVGTEREDFYLLLGELVPYKRADIAIEACRKAGKRLVVIGGGPDLDALSRGAPRNVSFLGRQEFPVVRDHLSRCRALLFPGIEDFGIVPVEAMASGAPVIAYRNGGAAETVIDGVTGHLFQEQTADSLGTAIKEFEEMNFKTDDLLKQAGRFSHQSFAENIQAFIQANLL